MSTYLKAIVLTNLVFYGCVCLVRGKGRKPSAVDHKERSRSLGMKGIQGSRPC